MSNASTVIVALLNASNELCGLAAKCRGYDGLERELMAIGDSLHERAATLMRLQAERAKLTDADICVSVASDFAHPVKGQEEG